MSAKASTTVPRREAISKRTRFEVFKRDSFKCQYCGKGAPDVLLQVDHIHPVSKGGKRDLLNLITACEDCNSGKSDVELSDNAALVKQRQQLEELSDRREQLEMLVKWREGLEKLNEQSLDAIAKVWAAAVPGWFLNEAGLTSARKLLHKHGAAKIFSAIDVARAQYIKTYKDGKPTQESVELAWSKVPGIITMSDMPEERRQLYYIRGILRKRMNYIKEWTLMKDLERAVESGVPTSYIKTLSIEARNWTQFTQWLEEAIKEHQANGEGEEH